MSKSSQMTKSSFQLGKEVKKMKKIFFAIMIVFAVVFAMSVQTVQATPILNLSSGSTSISVADGSADDANPLAGVITYIGNVGSSWYLNVATGILGGTASTPSLDLNSVDATGLAGGTLTITLSNQFAGPFTAGSVNSMVGGTTAGTVNFQTLLDNVAFSTLGTFGPGAFSGATTSGFSSFSGLLALQATISHSGAGVTSFNESAQVPEPGVMILFGSGLLALVGFRKILGNN